MLKRSVCGVLAVVLSGHPASAQTVQGSAEVGFGGANNQFGTVFRIFQVDGGAEVVLAERIGLGGRIGFAAGGGDAWIPLALNTMYYIPKEPKTSGFVPYVSGGYTRLAWLTEMGHENDYNVGGGFVYWADPHRGVLLEVCDVVRPGVSFTVAGVTHNVFPTRHWWSVNIGAAFR
jgi:hypothetical protein